MCARGRFPANAVTDEEGIALLQQTDGQEIMAIIHEDNADLLEHGCAVSSKASNGTDTKYPGGCVFGEGSLWRSIAGTRCPFRWKDCVMLCIAHFQATWFAKQ